MITRAQISVKQKARFVETMPGLCANAACVSTVLIAEMGVNPSQEMKI